MSRSGSFAIVGRSIRNGTFVPSISASRVASSCRDLLALLARQLAEVVLAGEAPQLADARRRLTIAPSAFAVLEVGQLRVALVDRREVERVLEARVVEVVLLVELGDEAVGPLADAVEVDGRRAAARAVG